MTPVIYEGVRAARQNRAPHTQYQCDTDVTRAIEVLRRVRMPHPMIAAECGISLHTWWRYRRSGVFPNEVKRRLLRLAIRVAGGDLPPDLPRTCPACKRPYPDASR